MLLTATDHPGVVAIGFERGAGHWAVDPLLLLTPVTEPNSNHLLLHGQLLRDQRDLLRVWFGVLQTHHDRLVHPTLDQ